MQFENKIEHKEQTSFNAISRKAKNVFLVSAALAFGALTITPNLFSQETGKNHIILKNSQSKTNYKILPQKTFIGDILEKQERKEKMINAVLHAKDVSSFKASRYMQKINAPEEDRKRFEKIMNALVKMESDEEIRTSVYAAFGEDEKEAAEEMQRKENINHAITITIYPTENAIVIQVFCDLKVGDEQFKKGSYIIYDEEGMKIDENAVKEKRN